MSHVAEQLREGTKELHAPAEGSPFVQRLFRRGPDRPERGATDTTTLVDARLAFGLHPRIFRAIEEAVPEEVSLDP